MSDKPKRGGARPGAGRKAKDGASETVRKAMSLDKASVEWALEIGDGEFSVGVRRALRLSKEMRDMARMNWGKVRENDRMRADDRAARDATAYVNDWENPRTKPRKPAPSKEQQRRVLDLMMGDRDRKLSRG
jgi:hypothetical protein